MLQRIYIAHTEADVFDRYDMKNSNLKYTEREQRTKTVASTKVYQIIEGEVFLFRKIEKKTGSP